MNSKINLINQEHPFHSELWCNVVAPKCKLERRDFLFGSWLFPVEKLYGLNIIRNPPLTPFFGLEINKELTIDNLKIIDENFYQQLPKFDFFAQKWKPCNSDLFEFKAKNFHLSRRKTYRLLNIKDHKSIHKGFSKSIKSKIKYLSNEIKVITSTNASIFFGHQKSLYQRKNIKPPFNLNILYQLIPFINKYCIGETLVAYDNENLPVGSIVLVYHDGIAYNILQHADNPYYKKGLSSLLIWEAIKKVSEKVDIFDFEGSMLPGVAKFYRSFGSIEYEYPIIYAYNSFLIKTANILLGKFKV